MLTVMEAIRWRRSIRRFKPDPVPDEVLREILEAARLAPSGSNMQPWRFIVVTDAEERKKIRDSAFGVPMMEEAPAIIVCCADLNAYEVSARRNRREELIVTGILADYEGSVYLKRLEETANPVPQEARTFIPSAMANSYIAIENIALAAASFGLGTCWVGAFEGAKVKALFDLPDNIMTVLLMPLGYPAQSPAPRPRLKLEQILLRPLPQLAAVPKAEKS